MSNQSFNLSRGTSGNNEAWRRWNTGSGGDLGGCGFESRLRQEWALSNENSNVFPLILYTGKGASGLYGN